jgi:hypothetical protein
MSSYQAALARVRQRVSVPIADPSSLRAVLSKCSIDPAFSLRAFLASDLIAGKYEATGLLAGPVGFPMDKVRLTADGAAQAFSGGFMVVRENKAEPVVTYTARVRFLGFRCNEESDHDQSTSSDEPYFVVALTNQIVNSTRVFGPFENVDGGESRFVAGEDNLLSASVQLPFTISAIAREHDEGDPKEAGVVVEQAYRKAVRVIQVAATLSAQVQVLAASAAVNSIFGSIGDVISEATVAVLGLGDDTVGSASRTIGEWNDGALEWKTPPRLNESPSFSEVPYNIKLDLGDDSEGKYSLYFNVVVFRTATNPVFA